MRKLILSLLLAGVASSPALAQRSDFDDRQEARAQREQQREQRREAREERQASEQRQARAERAERSVELRHSVDGSARATARAEGRADRRDLDQIRAAREPRSADREQLRAQRLDSLRRNGQLRQSERAVPPVLRNRVPVVSTTPQPGTQPPSPAQARRDKAIRWATDWRRDRNYDWYDWRNRNRSLFHLGYYYDPFGWGYQPYSIGWRMWPSYYRSSFWLHDPWQYRLPYAPAGYRWIRYYDDAILVDTWDGQVVDVIYNFFW